MKPIFVDRGLMEADFLIQVNSHPVNSHKTPGWQPYPNVGVAIAPSPQLGLISTHPSAKSEILAMDSSQTRMAAFQRIPQFDLGAPDAHVFQRPGIGVSQIHYEDEQPASFSQSPNYMLPSAPSGVLLDYGTTGWSPKTWDSMLNPNRTTHGSIYPEAESNNSMSQSQFAYILPNQSLTSGEFTQSINAAITAISSSDAPGPDRILPTPTCRGQQVPSSSAGFLPTEALTGLSLPSDFKSAFWSPRMGTSPDQRTGLTHTVPSNGPFTNSSPSNKCSNAPELLFTYAHMPTTTEDTTPSVSSVAASTASTSSRIATYPVLETFDSSSEYHSVPSDAKPTRSFSRDHSSAGQRLLALTTECAPDIYGYSSSEKGKARGAEGADARTLVSGLPYTRVQHRDMPGTSFSFNLLPDVLPEYHRAGLENVHRQPVEPLGNQGAY